MGLITQEHWEDKVEESVGDPQKVWEGDTEDKVVKGPDLEF